MPGAQGPKTVKWAQSDRIMYQDCYQTVYRYFTKIITPAYLLYRSGPVAIYYSRSECLPENYTSYATVSGLGLVVAATYRPIVLRTSLTFHVLHADSGR